VSRIHLAPHEEVETTVVDAIGAHVEQTLGCDVSVLAAAPTPAFAWDATRKQYSSSAILAYWGEHRPSQHARVLAVTGVDIFIPMLTFLFGQAQLDGTLALISLARLRPESYGPFHDPELLLNRARKEALHELGHTLGLTHCSLKSCVMSLATTIHQVDEKNTRYCPECGADARWASLVADDGEEVVP
jgi:archaemetzincin